jgi:phosphoenolpyruvate---glycerone phosphotransferase subunit DhaM
LISLVLVSHSSILVEGLRDMVAQVAGDDVRVTTAGGTGDGRLGTSAPLITEALLAAIGGPDGRADGVLVLLDLGSAALSLELALEELDPRDRAIVRVSDGPLVEGAIVAAVESSVGSSLDDVERAAAGAMTLPKMPKA